MGVNYNTQIVTDGLVLCLDAANPKSLSQNVHPNPTDIYSWLNWPVGNNCTLSRDTIASPVGNTPLKMVVTGNDPFGLSYNSSVWNLAPAASGQTWTVSAWVKASAATTAQLFIFEALDNGGYVQAPAGTTSIGTNWQRISFSYTFVNALTTKVQVRLDGPDTGGTGVIIWWDGLQVERSATATAFNAIPNVNRAQWRDVISSTTAVFSNNPAFGSSTVTFDGINQIATIPNESKFNFNSYQTIGILLKPTEADANRRNPYNQAYAGGGTITHEVAGGFNYYYGTAGDNTTPYTGFGSGFTVAQNETAYITIVRDPNFTYWYKNGVFSNSAANPYGSTVVTGTSPILIGFGYAGAYMGNINVVHVYTKALSAAQVMQNFNAIRGRYGL